MLPAAAKKAAALLAARGPTCATSTTACRCPGIDWRIEVNKGEAAKYQANVNIVGTGVQLVTNGTKVTEFRPSDNDKSVDILVRFPPDRRSLEQIDELRIQTPAGNVPIGNFVKRVPAQRVGNINRDRRQPHHHGLVQRRRGRAERSGAAAACRRSSPRPISDRA